MWRGWDHRLKVKGSYGLGRRVEETHVATESKTLSWPAPPCGQYLWPIWGGLSWTYSERVILFWKMKHRYFKILPKYPIAWVCLYHPFRKILVVCRVLPSCMSSYFFIEYLVVKYKQSTYYHTVSIRQTFRASLSGWFYLGCSHEGFRGGSVVKKKQTHLPMQEMWVQSLGWEDPLERKWQPIPVFLPV